MSTLEERPSTLDGDVQELLDTSKNLAPSREEIRTLHVDHFYGCKLFGFDFLGNNKEEDENLYRKFKKHIEYLGAVGTDTDHIRRICRRDGIPIVGIIPTKVLLKLCETHHLSMFAPDSEGRVEIATGTLQKIGNEAANKVERYTFWGEKKYNRVLYEESVAAYEAVKAFIKETDRYDLFKTLFPETGIHERPRNVRLRSHIKLNFPISDTHFEISFRKCLLSKLQPIVIVNPKDVDIEDFLGHYLQEKKKDIARSGYNKRRSWFSKKKKKVHDEPATSAPPSHPSPLLAIAHGSVHVLVAQHGNWLLTPETIKHAVRKSLRI